jgi:type I restriction enzyme S subunit
MKWQTTNLGSIVKFSYGKGLPEEKRKDGNVPVYGSSGIVGFHEKALITGPGIIIGRKGNVGSVFFENNNFYPIDTVYYIQDAQESVNLKFLYYLLKNLPLAKLNSDAAVPGLNRERALKIKILRPSLPDQEKIASILSSYDDLIDINRRRIQLLEEAARLLFREWFVHFRFPGHEKVKIVDRDGRKMPAEWDYLPFAKIKIFKKAPLGVPVFTDIRQYYQTSEIDGTTITGDGEEVDYENRPSRANIAPTINTVYFAKMKDTNKVLYFNKGNSFLLEKILLSTGMVGFTTDEKYLGFLFSLLKSYEFVQYKNNFATGATQVSLNNASLKKIKVLFPKLNLIELYSEIVNPLLEKCSLLRIQNQKLAQARDLLLPRLMNGTIDVSESNIKVPEEVEI